MMSNEESDYERGKRDEQLRAMQSELASIKTLVKEGFQTQWHEIDTLKKAVWLLYGAIAIIGFILPLVQKWTGG